MGISLIPTMAARGPSSAAPVYLAMQKPKPQRTIAACRRRVIAPTALFGDEGSLA
jgi:hypothetical protein